MTKRCVVLGTVTLVPNCTLIIRVLVMVYLCVQHTSMLVHIIIYSGPFTPDYLDQCCSLMSRGSNYSNSTERHFTWMFSGLAASRYNRLLNIYNCYIRTFIYKTSLFIFTYAVIPHRVCHTLKAVIGPFIRAISRSLQVAPLWGWLPTSGHPQDLPVKRNL